MNILEIPSNYKLCVSRISDDCIKAGPAELKWRGKVCSKCVSKMNSEYYSTNKKLINTKVVDKRRQKRAEKLLSENETFQKV
jgi:hypothetical protein